MFDDVADGTKVGCGFGKLLEFPAELCGLLDLPCFLCTPSAAKERRAWMLVFHKHSSPHC